MLVISALSLIFLSNLTGCSIAKKFENELFDTIEIRNDTSQAIHGVKLKVPRTNRIMSCSVILPTSSCSVQFPPIPNRHNPVTLLWVHAGKRYEKIIPNSEQNLPEHAPPYTAIVSILNQGQLEVVFK